MIDHIALRVRDLAAARRFYEAALKPLGYTLLLNFEEAAGFGIGGKPDFWIGPGGPSGPVHVAFTCPERGLVDAFHAAALEAGARDNGPPGLRPHYHAHYYGAFVLDPDGNNLEAVCHLPPRDP